MNGIFSLLDSALPRFLRHPFVLGLALFASPLQAQESPDSIDEMRKNFLRQMETAAEPIDKIFVEALEGLESELAAKRDYETALAVQRRRIGLEEKKGDKKTGEESDSTITLLPGKARTTGRISREGGVGVAADVLTGWKTVGSSATWDVQNITQGTYQVRIQYSCGEPELYDSNGDSVPETLRFAGGSFLFEQVTNLAGAADNSLSVKVESTGGWAKNASLNLGEIRMQSTSATFRIVATRVEPLGLMNLRRVYLIPKKEPGAGSNPGVLGSGEPPRLSEIKENHYARMSALRTPLAQNYVSELRALVDKLPSGEKKEFESFIDKEVVRAMEVARVSPPTPGGANPDSSSETLDGSAGKSELKALKGARWIDDPENRGDAFMVEHLGERFPVRLYFVTCPVPDTGDEVSAQYFKITRAEAGFVGREATRFTGKYLERRDLTLYPTGGKDPDGKMLVIVSLKGFGVYERILISRGLAMINPDLTAAFGDLNAPDYTKNILRPTEEKAKAGSRGAWSVSGRKDLPSGLQDPRSPKGSGKSKRTNP